LAEGGLNFHQSPGANKLTLQQKKILTVSPRVSNPHWVALIRDSAQRDLSLGMFEIANCFLEGVGTKKAPEVAISYLRNAGNLGDLAAQEREYHRDPGSAEWT
jgi:TPR repeat protein